MFKKNNFTLDDYRILLQQVEQRGSKEYLRHASATNGLSAERAHCDLALRTDLLIIDTMTPEERTIPATINLVPAVESQQPQKLNFVTCIVYSNSLKMFGRQ